MKMQALENQKIRTATSRNGVALQMEIYHDRRAARKGYFLYMPASSDTVVSKMKLHQVFDLLTQERKYKSI